MAVTARVHAWASTGHDLNLLAIEFFAALFDAIA
jgi:hypothetical protein